MGPSGGRRLIAFIDDLNMPKKDSFGSQPPLELLRQWIDYGGWYDRTKQSWRYIMDATLVAAMGPPGGGRTVISERLQSRFNLINFTFPSDAQVRLIFESILTPKLLTFGDEIKALGPAIVNASVQLYKAVIEKFLPTPSKAHYLFNMRDIAKVIQGVMQARRGAADTKETMLRLWAHEAMRVFSDRFTNPGDVSMFRDLLDERLVACDISYARVMAGIEAPLLGPVFCDFASEAKGGEGEDAPYLEVTDLSRLKTLLEDKLFEYNNEPGYMPMDLVLFRDAIRHVSRIQRVLRQPRGNCMLVGVGGSGRQSLARLAAWVSEMSVFQVRASVRACARAREVALTESDVRAAPTD